MEEMYYLGFSLFPGIGPVLFSQLLKKFSTAQKAWKSPQRKIAEIVGDTRAENFVAFRRTVDLEKELTKLAQEDIYLLTLGDKKYPVLLKQSSRPHTPKDNPCLEKFNHTVQREWLGFSVIGLDNMQEALIQQNG